MSTHSFGKTSKAKLSLVVNMNKSCKKLSVKQPSIFRVPEHLRRLNEDAYTPCHVSIGPFHRTGDRYSVMEEHKLVYTRDLILRCREWATSEDEIDEDEIKAYVDLVEKLEDEARKSYAEAIKLNKEEFVNMLLIDGCFIVEFLCRKIRKLSYMEIKSKEHGHATTRINGETTKARGTFSAMYALIENMYCEWEPANDFIFQSTRTSFEVRRDLTLLENQLPYFVLNTLFEFTFSGAIKKMLDNGFKERPKFQEVVYCALRTSIPNTTNFLTREDIEDRIISPEMTAHFVSFLRMCCRPPPMTPESKENMSEVQIGSEKVGGTQGSSDSTQGDSHTTEAEKLLAYATATGKQVSYPEQADEEHRQVQTVDRKIDIAYVREFPCLCNMETPHDIRVPSVTLLAKAGILFERTCRASKTPLLDIQFDINKGVLRMPPLTMWHHTETYFRNVMAHELYNHTANSKRRSVSDYMCFINDLISSKEDVVLLVKSGVIQNWLESDQVVADLFNSGRLFVVFRHL